jgi:hypothetical protein
MTCTIFKASCLSEHGNHQSWEEQSPPKQTSNWYEDDLHRGIKSEVELCWFVSIQFKTNTIIHYIPLIDVQKSRLDKDFFSYQTKVLLV